MSTVVDTLAVRFEAATDDFNREMEKNFGSGSTLGRLGAVAAGATAAAAAAITGFAATAINAGTDFEQRMTAAFRAVDDISAEMEADLTAGVRNIATETLQRSGTDTFTMVEHNDLGPLTVTEWFVYIRDHSVREIVWVRQQL